MVFQQNVDIVYQNFDFFVCILVVRMLKVQSDLFVFLHWYRRDFRLHVLSGQGPVPSFVMYEEINVTQSVSMIQYKF